MSHYKNCCNFTQLDESNWEFIYKIIKNFIGKENFKDIKVWKSAENYFYEKYKDNVENEYLLSFINHILPAERAFNVTRNDFNGLPESELCAYFMQNKYEEYRKIILDSFGTGYDSNIDYYQFFYNITLYDYLMPVELVQKKLVELCGLYSENAIDLISAFASTMIFADNIKKGVAIYEDLIEKNQFDILLYLRLCEALENVDEFELEKEYLNKAIDLAKINDDEVALELLENSLNYILKHIEKKPYEVVNMNIPTIMELIDNFGDYENIQKTIIDLVYFMHPDLQEIIFYEDDNEKVKEANEHIKTSAITIYNIINNFDLKNKFINLIKTCGEHEALNIIIDEVNK